MPAPLICNDFVRCLITKCYAKWQNVSSGLPGLGMLFFIKQLKSRYSIIHGIPDLNSLQMNQFAVHAPLYVMRTRCPQQYCVGLRSAAVCAVRVPLAHCIVGSLSAAPPLSSTLSRRVHQAYITHELMQQGTSITQF